MPLRAHVSTLIAFFSKPIKNSATFYHSRFAKLTKECVSELEKKSKFGDCFDYTKQKFYRALKLPRAVVHSVRKLQMVGLEDKIDTILTTINKFSTKIERIENKITTFKVSLTKVRAL